MITVNAIGDNCPIPVVKTKKAMQGLTGEETIVVLVDNEIAVANVTKFAAGSGARSVTSEQLKEKEYRILIEVAANEEGNHEPEKKGDTVVVIASDRMGEGNDELGRVLIKGFIFAISQLEELPKTILFYNGGATLTAEGSDCIADLKEMETAGVEILTCGTCLNYYEMTDKLEVGQVTNMYTIVEKISGASKIIRP